MYVYYLLTCVGCLMASRSGYLNIALQQHRITSGFQGTIAAEHYEHLYPLIGIFSFIASEHRVTWNALGFPPEDKG
ncbi:hypothetical protein V8F20_007346 [Naviculisporaceae sp. PSN 640]